MTVAEVDAGTVTATFTATLSAASGKTVTVDYATSDLTATAPADYAAATGTLTFPPGTTTRPVAITLQGDVLDEANETYRVTLSNPSNATITTATGTGTITDNDAAPSIAINDVSLSEGNAGTSNASFAVTLSAPSGQNVTVNYTTANATAVAPGDYTTTSGTLTFTPGQVLKTIPVPVVGDVTDEIDETYVVNLSGATNATIADTQGLGTIVNDDTAPSLTINDVSITEGNAGTANVTFTATLSAASGKTVTVGYATADGTATAPADYTLATGTLTFNPGVLTRTFTVAVVGDTRDEFDETFVANLSSPVNATIADGQGVGTILDNDPIPTLSINNVTVTEVDAGTNTATFTATLSAASGKTVTVDYATSDVTATAPADYTRRDRDPHVRPGGDDADDPHHGPGRPERRGQRDVPRDAVEPGQRDDRHRDRHRHDHRQRPRSVDRDQRRDGDGGQRRDDERELHRVAVGPERHERDRELHHGERDRDPARRLHDHVGHAHVHPGPGDEDDLGAGRGRRAG